MSTKAIYTVHERGKDFHFFSEYAGGFSYPFAAANFLSRLKYVLDGAMSPQKNLCVSPLLDQLEGNYRFPEEAKGKKIFYAVEEGKISALASRQEVPFMIEIDMSRIRYRFVLIRSVRNCRIFVTSLYKGMESRENLAEQDSKQLQTTLCSVI